MALILAGLVGGCGTSPAPIEPPRSTVVEPIPEVIAPAPAPAPRTAFRHPLGNPIFEHVTEFAAAHGDESGVGIPLHLAGIAVDELGSTYISDQSLSRIVQIGLDGRLEVIAGNGTRTSGSDGPATQSGLLDPGRLAAHSRYGIFFASRSQIRHISTDGYISLLAGLEQPGLADDPEGLGVAQFNGIAGLALDGAGNLYVADRGNNRVRRVDRSGAVTTYAGTGARGSGGDGGSALAASFDRPSDLVVGPDGSIFLTEQDGHVIRRIDPDGIVSTIAGTGLPGRSGDGGPAVAAQLNAPRAVDIDAGGYLYVADWNNAAIRVITPEGLIHTYAGLATAGPAIAGDPAREAQLDRPIDIALGPDGAIYLLGQLTGRVDRLASVGPDEGSANCRADPSPLPFQAGLTGNSIGAIEWFGRTGFGFGGDGLPVAAANFAGPDSIAIGPSGLYIADTGNNRIRRVAGGIAETVAGSGEAAFRGDGGLATFAVLSSPKTVLADAVGNVYFFDAGNFRIRQIDPCGVISTIAGNGRPGDVGNGGPAISVSLFDVAGMAMDAGGAIYIADSAVNRIVRLDPTGQISLFAGNGEYGPAGVGQSALNTTLANPAAVAVGGEGLVYISENGSGRILAVSPADGLIQVVAEDVEDAGGMAITEGGAIYVAGESVGRLDQIAPSGRQTLIDSTDPDNGLVAASIPAPRSLALRGNQLVVLGASGVVWVLS